MKKNPLVSIVLTYYKKRRFIKKTLISIENQTYNNTEIIFVYDDLNRNDLVFIKKLIKRFKNIKLILNKKNLGVAKSRNIAIQKCRGEFISFIDADDIWKPRKLEKQIKIMIKKQAEISYTSYHIIDDNDKRINTRNVSNTISYNKLIKSCEIGLSTVVVRRKIFRILKFPNLKTQEDFALWLKLIRLKVNFLPINKTLSYWRKAENSLSSNKIQKLLDAFKVFYKLENKNFIISVYSVLILSINKILKI